MKVTIAAINTPNIWRFSRTPELRIYALNDFFTDGGQLILKGTIGTDEPHLKVQCELTGGSVLYIPSLEIDSTPLDRSVFYTAVFTVSGRRVPFLSNFAIPAEPVATTWPSIKLFQRLGRMRFVNPPMAELQTLVASMITAAIQSALASRLQSGVATLVDGEVEVPTSVITFASRIAVNSMDENVVGNLRTAVADIIENESFVIRSSNVGDNGFVSWIILY